jgi:3-hydroxyisobutyrate dehydrogenase
MSTIGFIGLGHMGNPMAHHLLSNGHTLLVMDINPDAVSKMVNDGAHTAANYAELAAKSDIVITMVQTGEQVNEICLGKAGIFANAKSDLLYIDCSSIDIVTTRELHKKAEASHIAMLDAPVSGGVAGAEQGGLTFMVGGKESVYQRALPILNAMGKKIVHAGEAGSGQAAKICNNLLLGISMIGVSEAFMLAEKLGLDAKKFFEISSNASGQCWSMTKYCPVPGILGNVPSDHQYEPGFMAKMMLKDLLLGKHAADAVDAFVPLGEVATEMYGIFVKRGNGEKDFSAIIKMLE